MGLSDGKPSAKKSAITLEENALGLDAEHDTDKMIDEYMALEKRKESYNALTSVERKGDISKARHDKSLLKIKTFGFKDGVLQHNMPCPVCLENMARYISDDKNGYFAPCRKCESDGYVLKNKKRKGFWS